MNLMRATFARAACGMSSRFASPRLILRSKDFRAESWPGLNTFGALVFGYFEPGTATAAALGMRQRFFFQSGGGTPLFPSRSHRFGPGCRRTLFVFGLFSGHPSIKN